MMLAAGTFVIVGFTGEYLSFILFFAAIGIGIPVAAGIAILKYRLYDLDIVVKKSILSLFSTDGRLRFEVSDDGTGFDPGSGRGTGLQGMADRLEATGGTLEVRSSPGAGATVAGVVPVSLP